ncbi:glycosyltransferase [Ruania alba]|uniref:Glycosyltransferase, catalytic subunit of cellulose synthase and poly-beta-1,6-N-acetylglucosamine synthase n=1 Tax=Ruania alba TaxID=648782 RepID=A0A1H5M3K8_9MICO|nr:glycosyltransferase family 2 protein [Ruania alba]SEE83800.1 Glycosyltransferase, catalytic subunit of cellulose synthase and poly-beta-1,6-N-acetylglucosamine synthase [Ruania alba]
MTTLAPTIDASTTDRSDDRLLIAQAIARATRERRIIVLIPAYNEASSIGATIASVAQQSVQPTATVVVANNCSDGTEAVAREHGALVFLAEPNRDKKAGALNMALEYVVPLLENSDAILAMDADTTLSPTFIEVASERLTGTVGGVGGAFIGRESSTTVGYLQRMEYYRYRREIVQRGERAFVLSGTGALISVAALTAVKACRDGETLPAGSSFYDTFSLTEDNELTFALLACGYQCLSPVEMTTTTDVMESPSMLWQQRHRWYLGALRNLQAYGSRMPWHMRWVYWRQQAGLTLSVLAVAAHVILVAILLGIGGFTLSPLWVGLAACILLANMAMVWRMGRRARILTLTVEPFYNVFLLAIFCAAAVSCVSGKKGEWVHT